MTLTASLDAFVTKVLRDLRGGLDQKPTIQGVAAPNPTDELHQPVLHCPS
jgi:hypothetical protein